MKKTGYYGKIAAHGGFISNRLPQTFTAVWHDWSEQLVNICLQTNPEQTDYVWYQLPTYRFALSAGVAGENVWIGLLIPSRDSVGRKFPFCLARPLADHTLPGTALTTNEGYFRALEEVVTQLDEHYTDAHLASALEAIDLAHELADPETSEFDDQTAYQAESDSLAIRLTARLTGGANNRELFQHAMLRAACGSYSIWMTSDISSASDETLLCEGLPAASACAALFDGYFDPMNWSNVVLANAGPQHRATPPDEVISYMEPAQSESDTTMKSPLSAAGENPTGHR
jgi:type VI secretion system protein ImpM